MQALPALPADPSKEQEIEWFKRIAQSVPSEAYLASFFSTPMQTWVETKILDDWNLDLLGTVKEMQSAIWKLEAEYKALQNTTATEQTKANETIDSMGKQIDLLTERVHKWEAEHREDTNEIIRLRQAMEDEQTKHQCEVNRLKLTIADMFLAKESK